MQQRDAGAAIGIVFDGRDLGLDANLVALEIDFAVRLLVPAADEPRRNPPRARPAAGFRLPSNQALFRPLLSNILARHDRLKPSRRGRRPIALYWHNSSP